VGKITFALSKWLKHDTLSLGSNHIAAVLGIWEMRYQFFDVTDLACL